MKPTSAFALAALAFAGTACSQAAAPQEPATMAAPAEATVQTVSAEAEPEGTFNLSLPSPTDTTEGEGTFNLNLGGGEADDELLIGGGGLVDTDFGDAPAVDLALPEAPLIEAAPEDDGIIRLESN